MCFLKKESFQSDSHSGCHSQRKLKAGEGSTEIPVWGLADGKQTGGALIPQTWEPEGLFPILLCSLSFLSHPSPLPQSDLPLPFSHKRHSFRGPAWSPRHRGFLQTRPGLPLTKPVGVVSEILQFSTHLKGSLKSRSFKQWLFFRWGRKIKYSFHIFFPNWLFKRKINTPLSSLNK